MEIIVREEIKASQYDKRDIPDTWDVSGALLCRAELEGLPEVTMALSLPSLSNNTNKLVKPTDLSPRETPSSTKDPGGDTGSSSDDSGWDRSPPSLTHVCLDTRVQGSDVLATRRLCFTPPLGRFVLATYGVSHLRFLPLRGFYQMKDLGNGQVRILAQLKLQEGLRNQFEYCRVVFPFHGRGILASSSANPTVGAVTIDESRGRLIWTIGHKFPSRSLEVALPATLQFQNQPQHQADPVKLKDPFCVDLSCYMQIRFKMQHFTLSGLTVDLNDTVIYPQNQRAVIQVTREVIGSQYYVWNSLAKHTRHALAPPKEIDHF